MLKVVKNLLLKYRGKTGVPLKSDKYPNLPGTSGIFSPKNLSIISEILGPILGSLDKINIGFSTLISFGIGPKEKFTKVLKWLVALQLSLDTFYGLIQTRMQISNSAFEPNDWEIVENFLHRYGFYNNARDLEFNAFTNEYDFISYLIKNYELVSAITPLSKEPYKCCRQEFVRDIQQRLILTNYLFVLRIENVLRIFLWNTMAKNLRIYNVPNEQEGNGIKTIMSLHNRYLVSLTGQMLVVQGRMWPEEFECLKIVPRDIVEPKFYRQETKEKLKTLLENSLRLKESCGILLYGLPGVGKSCALLAAVCDSDIEALIVSVDYYPTESLINFLNKVTNIPKIVIFEEIDSESVDRGKNHRVQAILKFLDSDCYDVAIMTSNSVKLHKALIRSGRCDVKMLLEPPTYEERKDILLSLGDAYVIDITKDNVENLAKVTEGLTHADLHTICKLAQLENVSFAQYLPEYEKQQEQLNKFAEVEDE